MAMAASQLAGLRSRLPVSGGVRGVNASNSLLIELGEIDMSNHHEAKSHEQLTAERKASHARSFWPARLNSCPRVSSFAEAGERRPFV